MKDQKISTMLGAIILIIIAATVAGFVILCFKKYPVESDIEPFVISQDKEKNVHEGTSEKSVSITNKGDRNYVTYVDEYKNEIIIDQAPLLSKQFVSFSLSPKENYVLYSNRSYEHENMEMFNIYNIAQKRNIENISGMFMDFTIDEKYLYSCGPDYFLGYGEVYSVPEFKKIYSLHGRDVGFEMMEFYNDYRVETCNFEERINSIRFFLRNIQDSYDTKQIYFNLDTLDTYPGPS